MSAFITGLPKAELHVHHVGSASPRIVAEPAARHPGTVPSDLDELRRFYEFRDFAHFIEVDLAAVALVRTPQDIRRRDPGPRPQFRPHFDTVRAARCGSSATPA